MIHLIHQRVLDLDLTLEQISERVEAHKRAAIQREQEATARLRQMLAAMPSVEGE
jgi:hypothetical protein